MRNVLLGALAGLVSGIFGMLIYGQQFGDGAKLTQMQADLDAANAKLAKAAQEGKSKSEALSNQVQELTSSNDELKHQIEGLKKASAPAPQPGMGAEMRATMMKVRTDQEMLLWKARLHLTPEQEATLRAAMEKRNQLIEEMEAARSSGQSIDPQALADLRSMKSPEQMLDDMLTPDQKTAYQQLKDDQKKSQAETAATSSMNQIAPLLQLTDAQKDQVYSVLYQSQIDSQNGMNAIHSSADYSSFLNTQAKAKEDALAKILTPDQMAIYHQQNQSQLQMIEASMQRARQQAQQQAAKTGGPVMTGAVAP